MSNFDIQVKLSISHLGRLLGIQVSRLGVRVDSSLNGCQGTSGGFSISLRVIHSKNWIGPGNRPPAATTAGSAQVTQDGYDANQDQQQEDGLRRQEPT